ncbi:hypothetical protein DCAR_0310229 [Daucus carota subsp. sativus]|uniref:Uncharacterized protein n=1 Tax=Daucus carota subsp. sativus TaxID=79200 RepID=A0A165ZPX3_DAUCS|nr:hypothetical protein DCAR_0310229 [Daucus carota subsp. sativus]
MAQLSSFIYKALMVALLASVAVSGQQMMPPSPAPSPTADSAGFSLPASIVFVATSLIFSLVALIRI